MFAKLSPLTFDNALPFQVQWENKIAVIFWQVFIGTFNSYYIYKLINVAFNWSSDYSLEYSEGFTDGTVVESSLKFVGSALIIACK